MAPTIDDLKYLYYLKQVGISGLSIQDLEYLFFSGQGIPQRPVGLPPDPSAVDVLYTPAPTIAVAAWADPGATYTLVPSDLTGTRFQYRGATDFRFGTVFPDTIMALPTSRFPHTYASPQSIWSVEFITDTSEFQLYWKDSTASGVYRLKIDGKRVTDLPQASGGTGSGGRRLMKVTFPDAKVRRICFEFAGMPFAGVYVLKPYSLWKPQPYYDRVMVIGDSIGGGSAINTGSSQGTWVPRLADMMGWDDIWNDCIGGTGYVTRNPGASLNNFLDRIEADVLAYNPRKIILFGGYNDNLVDPALTLANANGVAKLIQAKAPTATVVVFGPWSPRDPATAGVVNTNTSIKTMAVANNWVFVDQLTSQVSKGSVVLSPATGPWITGTGNTGAPANNGNADIYVGSDAIHPNDAGHKYLADRIYRSLLAAGF